MAVLGPTRSALCWELKPTHVRVAPDVSVLASRSLFGALVDQIVAFSWLCVAAGVRSGTGYPLHVSHAGGWAGRGPGGGGPAAGMYVSPLAAAHAAAAAERAKKEAVQRFKELLMDKGVGDRAWGCGVG
jgi:hypothetical protein